MLPTRRKSTHSLQVPTMPSKLENQGKSHVISPVLFMTVDGEPMRFFLCPGPAKVELQPHIKAGGGMVCKAQEPGAILLVDPNDVGSLRESTAHWYVSTQYIRDCIENNEQLELEEYRMKPPDATDAQSTKKRPSSTNMSTGRIAYTSEEDAAIVDYVATRTRLKGNLLWQEMEKKHVTHHSWQSMRYRYFSKLVDRPAEGREDGSRNDGDPKVAENQETGVKGSSPENQKASSSPDLTSSDLAQPDNQQTDDLPIEAGSSESPNIDPDSSSPPDPDVMVVEEPGASPAKSDKKPTPKMVASPVTPLRRSLRRQALDDTPPSDTPSRKKARTSSPRSSPKASPPAASPKASPPAASPKAASPPSQPPPPPHQLIESNQSADDGADPVTQKEAETRGKRKEKRKLGILEMATKEFENENDSESDYEETPDQCVTKNTQHPREPTSKPPTGTPDVAMETRTAVETGSAPKPHLFVFDSESQEEGSQPMDCDNAAVPAGPQPISKKAEVVSLTQAQLKEDMQRIRELIKQTNQDLVRVTKALLRTSGDFSAALALLRNPASARGPFWSLCHDRLLLTSDPKARQELQKRYGEQGVAKRLMFLNLGEVMNEGDELP